ncbi:hypothetical protein HY639_03725 [Candidatus Woesearchaeota archaeon]|nr:hypothetical protein [Candidatus Woesearchaeota archaeon]
MFSILENWLATTKDSSLLAITHNGKCCDSMGAILAFAHYAKAFGKDVTCIFSRPHSWPMSERLYDEVVAPKGIMVLGETLEETGLLEKEILSHSTLFALDTSSTQNSTYLPVILNHPHGSNMAIYAIDHHEAGFEDISDLPNGKVLRVTEAQSASALMLTLLREKGVIPTEQDILTALYLGIYQDTRMLQPADYSPMTREALAELDVWLTTASKDYIENIKATPCPQHWQQHLAEALAYSAHDKCLVVGLGVIDNPGIVSYVSDGLLAAGKSDTAIVVGLTHERVGKKSYLDLVASGRSNGKLAESLPLIFSAAFYIEQDSRCISRGGGKINKGLASCAASIPLAHGPIDRLWTQEIKKLKANLLACDIPEECMTWTDSHLNR